MFLVTTPMLCVGCLNLSINSLTTWRIEFRECSAQDLMAFKLHFFHNNLKMIPFLIVFWEISYPLSKIPNVSEMWTKLTWLWWLGFNLKQLSFGYWSIHPKIILFTLRVVKSVTVVWLKFRVMTEPPQKYCAHWEWSKVTPKKTSLYFCQA